MSLLLDDNKRSIIPRWRDFLTTLMLGELTPSGSISQRLSTTSLETSLTSRVADWENHKTVSFAADLVAAAIVDEITSDEIREAATFLLSREAHSPKLAKMLAVQILSPDESNSSLPPEELQSIDVLVLRKDSAQQIRQLRRRLVHEPRNAILLVDMARHYTVLGLKHRAQRSMRMAIQFGGENRFVLRSAARFYVHEDDPEKAHDLLRKARATRHDPWLLAAEIAVASETSRISAHMKSGYQILDNANYSLFETTELASAIATVEMLHDNAKGARKLFRRALKEPTENSVAQADWASRHMLGNLDIPTHDDPPRIYEAQAWDHYKKAEWKDSLDQSLKWLYDQPFSIPAILFSGFIASTIFEDYELSSRILKFGMLANPTDPYLLNNLVFTLASANQVGEARQIFDRIDKSSLNEESEIVVKATEGLLHYREGAYEQGWRLYSEAIHLSRSKQHSKLAVRAAIYRAREELLAKAPHANTALEYAFKESSESDDKIVPILLKRMETLQLLRPPK